MSQILRALLPVPGVLRAGEGQWQEGIRKERAAVDISDSPNDPDCLLLLKAAPPVSQWQGWLRQAHIKDWGLQTAQAKTKNRYTLLCVCLHVFACVYFCIGGWWLPYICFLMRTSIQSGDLWSGPHNFQRAVWGLRLDFQGDVQSGFRWRRV